MTANAFNLNDFLSNLTTEPGIYQMLNDEGKVLYVGKARNLKIVLVVIFDITAIVRKPKPWSARLPA